MADNGPYSGDRLDRFEAKLDMMAMQIQNNALETAIVKERLFAVDLVERNRKAMWRVALTTIAVGVSVMTLILNLTEVI